ncbi:MAG: Hsp20/alpha crystallin family protein [Anaerolineae bacterium]
MSFPRQDACSDEEDVPSGQSFPRSARDENWYSAQRRRVWRPPTDVYETERHIVVKVEVSGMHEEDFEISFADRRLVIAGHRRDAAEKLGYQNMEIRYGDFRTEVRVGWPLDESAIEATYEEGFLYVKLPKQVQEYRVQIQVGADKADLSWSAADQDRSADD